MHNFIKLFQKVQEIEPFSEFGPWQSLNQRQMAFDTLLGYIWSISMCMENFITVFHSVQEIGPFSLFQNLELDTTSKDYKCHFAISLARSCQYQCVCKIYQTIPNVLRVVGIFRELSGDKQLHKLSGDRQVRNST